MAGLQQIGTRSRIWLSKSSSVDISPIIDNGLDAHTAYCTKKCTASLYRGVKRPGRHTDHPSSPGVQVKGRVDLSIHSPSVSYGLLQTVLYLYVEFQINFSVTLSHLTPFCPSENGLLTSFLVASVSYHNCTDMLVTYHVTVQRYCECYMLVTSIIGVILCDVKKWY